MKVNKTVAALALSASSSAFALIAPPQDTKTICVSVYETADGVKYAGGCDEVRNNEAAGLPILENGCAANQIALTATRWSADLPYNIEIGSCLPPNVVQL